MTDMDRIADMHGLPFKTDKVSLDAQRDGAEIALGKIAATYASQFDAFSAMVPAAARTVTYIKPDFEGEVLAHHEVKGHGDTVEEAVADWRRELATKPQSGRHLIWRVRPEVAWDKDFQMQKVRWMVYARFAVLP